MRQRREEPATGSIESNPPTSEPVTIPAQIGAVLVAVEVPAVEVEASSPAGLPARVELPLVPALALRAKACGSSRKAARSRQVTLTTIADALATSLAVRDRRGLGPGGVRGQLCFSSDAAAGGASACSALRSSAACASVLHGLPGRFGALISMPALINP